MVMSENNMTRALRRIAAGGVAITQPDARLLENAAMVIEYMIDRESRDKAAIAELRRRLYASENSKT